MKKFTPIVATILMASSSNLAADEFASMHKQLKIMSNIITSSVSASNPKKGARITGVESTYLKGQGVVFTVNSNSRSSHWGNYNFNFVMPELPSLPPVPPVGQIHVDDERDYTVVIEEDISEAMEEAAEKYELAFDKANNHREMFRDLEKERRELAYEVRDLEREKRDLEYQARRADEESKKEIQQELKKIAAEREKIKSQSAALTRKTAEFRQQQKVKKVNQEKERQQYYQQLTQTLVESFCLYGNGLKAVPKTENVSLIVKSAGGKDKGRYKDKIYVFNKKDISACAMDNITVDGLLKKGKGYEF